MFKLQQNNNELVAIDFYSYRICNRPATPNDFIAF